MEMQSSVSERPENSSRFIIKELLMLSWGSPSIVSLNLLFVKKYIP